MNPITNFLTADKVSILKNNNLGNPSKAERETTLFTFKKNLPKLKNRHIILEDGRKVKAGNILRRPIVKNLLFGDIYHYCFVYGTSIEGSSVIIEMTLENNVKYSDIKEFLKTHSIDSVEIINKETDTKMKDIISRASEWTDDVYHGYTKNCQQFANYCVFGKYVSPGVDFLNKLILPWIKIAIGSTENSILIENDQWYIEQLKNLLHELKLIYGIMQSNIDRDAKIIANSN